jgi:hypothetical protein
MADPVPSSVPTSPAAPNHVPVMPQAPVHPQPPQFEIPSFRAPDVQMLVQDLATSRRDLFEERKNSQLRIAEERERSRFEIDKIRGEANAQIKALERENDALLRGLGRLQAENDSLREENAALRHSRSNGHVEEKAPPALPPAQDVISQLTRTPGNTKVPLVIQGVQGVPRGAMPVVLQPPPQVMGNPSQGIAP